MSAAKTIRNRVSRIPRGEPFTNKRFLKLGSRAEVNRTLSRLVKAGMIQRIFRGMFVRPRKNRYVGYVTPGVNEIVKVLAKDRGETIQKQGAAAVNRLGLCTQMPVVPIYWTSGRSREFKIGKLPVKLKHVSPRKLQMAGQPPGLALSALWCLGKRMVDARVVRTIQTKLTAADFAALKQADMPIWMADALEKYAEEMIHA